MYPNSINYTLSLLSSSLLLLSLLVSSSLLPSLSLFLIFLIYIGAIIVLIAYVCAITPNLLLSPFLNISFTSVVFPFILFFMLTPKLQIFTSPLQLPLTDFFYRPFGASLLIVILLLLFVVLLIVTTQHSNPKGPFRSISL